MKLTDGQKKQKLVFKKGIGIINIQFFLNDLSPWQEQISREIEKCKKRVVVKKSAEIEKCKKRVVVKKSACWGFEIN